MSQFAIDSFSWKPALIGMMFSIMGIQDILSQAFVMPKLLIRLTDKQIAVLGMIAEIIGYSLIATSSIFTLAPLLVIGMFVFGFGDSIFGPSFNGMVSKAPALVNKVGFKVVVKPFSLWRVLSDLLSVGKFILPLAMPLLLLWVSF